MDLYKRTKFSFFQVESILLSHSVLCPEERNGETPNGAGQTVSRAEHFAIGPQKEETDAVETRERERGSFSPGLNPPPL